MYFPYLRGRQYELLALRELVSRGLLSTNILPVVEPVKLSSTLSKTMDEFVNKERNLAIVCNPAVGSFNSDMRDEEKDINRQRFLDLLDNPYIVKSHIMKADSQAQILSWKKSKNIQEKDWLVICNNQDYVDLYQGIFGKIPPKYVLIPDQLRRKISRQKVLLEDRFKKCNRNADYSKNSDEFFSEDHIFYKEEKYVGFGDYSVIGEDYLEAGFAPYAVAIHIVYFATDNTLRVHHFVSDSNTDTQNPAKKFYEAVQKLSIWVHENNIPLTAGLSAFLEHYQNQTYPGLGSVKKLSLMHHLELIGLYLDEEK